MPMAARSKAQVFGRSLADIVSSKLTGCMDVGLLLLLCVARQKSLRQANHSSRVVQSSVVCLSVIMNPR